MIFNAAMVQALLAGRKTQHRVPITRLRIRKRFTKVTEFGPSTTKGYDWHFRDRRACWNDLRDAEMRAALPCAIGDRLSVRELWRASFWSPQDIDASARTWEDTPKCERTKDLVSDKWFGADSHLSDAWDRPTSWLSPVYMPRWASRLTLIVTDVRVQRVQEISADDAVAEGINHTMLDCYGPACPSDPEWSCNLHGCCGRREVFRDLWDATHAKRPEHQWKANPWVCALTFDVMRANIDEGAA